MAHQLKIDSYNGKFKVTAEQGAALLCMSKDYGNSVSEIVSGLIKVYLEGCADYLTSHRSQILEKELEIKSRNARIRKRYDRLTKQGFYRSGKGKKSKDT